LAPFPKLNLKNLLGSTCEPTIQKYVEKGFHVIKSMIKFLFYFLKTLFTPILGKNLSFWMKPGQTLLGEKKEQRVQAKRAKRRSYFNLLFSLAWSLVDPQNLLN